MVVVMMTVTRATIYEVTHEREAALNFAPPRFTVEKTHKLLWKLRKTAFILLCQPQTQKWTALSFSTTVSGHIQVVWQSCWGGKVWKMFSSSLWFSGQRAIGRGFQVRLLTCLLHLHSPHWEAGGQAYKDDKPAPCLEDRTIWKIMWAAWACVHVGLQLPPPGLV